MSAIQGSGAATEIGEALNARRPATGNDAAGAEKPAEAAGKAAEATAGPDAASAEKARVKTMEDRLAALETKETETTQRRAAEDLMHDFLRSETVKNIPIRILKKFITPSTDVKAMTAQAVELGKLLNGFVASEVKRGTITYRTIGGSVGGSSPAEFREAPKMSAYGNIADGLKGRHTEITHKTSETEFQR